jgi:hypothetical protein
MSQQAMPSALVTPTRPKLRHEGIPAAGLDPKGWRVTIRTAIAFWEQVEKKDGREYRADYEKSADDEDAQNRL